MATIAAAALAIGAVPAAIAQTGAAPTDASEQYGDSPSLSSGVPITAPNAVDPSQLVNIIVEGSNDGSRIELWGPIGEAIDASQLAQVPLTGGVAALTAPDRPGTYELRYVDEAGKQRGRRAFDVAAVPVTLTMTTPISPGGVADVTWQGPAQPGDRFDIAAETGAVVDSTPLVGDPASSNVSQITAPQERGRYELRYVTGAGTVLRSVTFEVR